jgi:trehalose 6-phosphate synthase/phosphatase
MGKIIIVSNRLPVKISDENGQFVYSSSEGGLATGLSSIYSEGDNVWIGWPGLEVSDLEKQAEVCLNLKKMKLIPVFLSQEDISEYYEGFSNEILWPIFHYYASTYTNYKQSNCFIIFFVNEYNRGGVIDVVEVEEIPDELNESGFSYIICSYETKIKSF